jgi:hypothetical protein
MVPCVAEPEPRAEEPKLNAPGAEITSCGSGSFPFIKDLKKEMLKKNITVAE